MIKNIIPKITHRLNCSTSSLFSIRNSQSEICNFQFAIRNPKSVISNPQSAIRDPKSLHPSFFFQSAICNSQSAISSFQSAIRNPQFLFFTSLLIYSTFSLFSNSQSAIRDPKSLPPSLCCFSSNHKYSKQFMTFFEQIIYCIVIWD